MPQNHKPERKPIILYRNLTLLIVFSLFVTFTLVYVIVVSINPVNTPSWLEKVHEFILSLYPSIFMIPFAFLFGLLILRPVQEAEREANEESLLEKIKDALIPATRTAVVNAHQISDSIQRMGIIEVHPRVDYDILRTRIAHSKERVYLSDNWFMAHNIYDFEESFRLVALHKVPMRILMIHPDSAAARLRSIDLYNDDAHMRSKTMRTTEALKKFSKKFQMDNLEVRYHSLLPSIQIFLCDNQAKVGLYFHGIDSQYCTQLDVIIKNEKDEHTLFGKQIVSEFEIMWESAEIVAL